MSMVGFPLLLIPLAIYNIIVLLMPGVSFAEPLVTLPLTSGARWPVTLSDGLLALGIVMLLFEVIKGARPGAKFLTDHLLSLIVFGGAVAEFLLWPRFASSTFFLLALLALADFLSGIALRTRRGAAAVVTAPRESRQAAAPVEHRREPDIVRPTPAVVEPEPAPVEHPAPPAVEPPARPAPGFPPEAAAVPPEQVVYPRLHPGPGMPKPAETKPAETKPAETKPPETDPPEAPNKI
jgi:hypothetical protein